jgi:hypothetical protein
MARFSPPKLGSLATLRRWLRHLWVSRVSVVDWLQSWISRWLLPQGGRHLGFQPALEVLEGRQMPSISVIGIPFAAAKGQSFRGAVAEFTPDSGTTLTDYSATILWGDGSSSAGSLSASGTLYQVSGTHTYAGEGPVLLGIEVDGPTLGD